MRFLKISFVILRHYLFTLASNLPENLFDVISVLIYQFVRLFKPNTFNRFQVVTARQNTSDQQHLLSESPKI